MSKLDTVLKQQNDIDIAASALINNLKHHARYLKSQGLKSAHVNLFIINLQEAYDTFSGGNDDGPINTMPKYNHAATTPPNKPVDCARPNNVASDIIDSENFKFDADINTSIDDYTSAPDTKTSLSNDTAQDIGILDILEQNAKDLDDHMMRRRREYQEAIATINNECDKPIVDAGSPKTENQNQKSNSNVLPSVISAVDTAAIKKIILEAKGIETEIVDASDYMNKADIREVTDELIGDIFDDESLVEPPEVAQKHIVDVSEPARINALFKLSIKERGELERKIFAEAKRQVESLHPERKDDEELICEMADKLLSNWIENNTSKSHGKKFR